MGNYYPHSTVKACQVSCGKGNLQVEAAGIGIHIYNFAGKEKPFYQPGFHGAGINFLNRHAAGSNDSLFNRPEAFNVKLQPFKK